MNARRSRDPARGRSGIGPAVICSCSWPSLRPFAGHAGPISYTPQPTTPPWPAWIAGCLAAETGGHHRPRGCSASVAAAARNERLLGYGYVLRKRSAPPRLRPGDHALRVHAPPVAGSVTGDDGAQRVDHDFWSPGRHRARDLGLPRDTFVYLYFGRPGVSKGVECLLDAAVLVRRQLPRSRLVMILFREPAASIAHASRIDALGDHILLVDRFPQGSAILPPGRALRRRALPLEGFDTPPWRRPPWMPP